MKGKVIFFKIYFAVASFCFKYLFQPFLILFTLLYPYYIRMVKRPSPDGKPRLVWGPLPLINNKYYNLAMRSGGYHTRTFMKNFYEINKKSDYDLYYEDFAPRLPKFFMMDFFFMRYVSNYFAFCHSIKNYDIFHHPFSGGFLQYTPIWKMEAKLLKAAGCKTVILGYGADFYRYSKVLSLSWLHGLLSHYPQMGLIEDKIETKVQYWSKHADCIINGMQIDHLGRWDVLPFRAEVIDTDAWKPREAYSDNDGLNGVVKLVHAPNHRFIKGTEYLMKAVEDLQKEGLQLELILLEKKPNDEVKRILHYEADIFFDQLILGYAMSTIEALATGLPVMTNLENEEYVRVFRRYSFLNECPAVSVSHENLKFNLRLLVRNPGLRKELGMAGRKYAEKYHSYRTAHYVFGRVYEKIWDKKPVDLINMYHPLLPTSYNNSLPLVEHPLTENRIGPDLLKKLNH
jgi:hypothetical protein